MEHPPPPESPKSHASDIHERNEEALFETPIDTSMLDSSFVDTQEHQPIPKTRSQTPPAISTLVDEVSNHAPPIVVESASESIVVRQQSPPSPLVVETNTTKPASVHEPESKPVKVLEPEPALVSTAEPHTPQEVPSKDSKALTVAPAANGGSSFNKAQFEADMALLKRLPQRETAAVAGVTKKSSHVGTIYHRGTGVKVRLTNSIDYVMDEENLTKLLKRGHVAIYDVQTGALLNEYQGFKLPTMDQLITNVVEYDRGTRQIQQ